MRAASRNRFESIDQFRGLAILLMVLANFLAGVAWVPAWLKHAKDIGLTVIDLIAPFFILAIGLTCRPSLLKRRKTDGTAAAVFHFVRRFLSLIGIGALISAGETLLGENVSGFDWGVLQAIGTAGLVTLPFLALPAAARAGIGLALLAAYQVLLDRLWLPTVFSSPHGGLMGSLGWSAMLIFATALADLFHGTAHRDGAGTAAPAESPRQSRASFPAASLAILAAGLALALLSPISKNRVSAAYVLSSLGAGGLLFYAFHLLNDRAGIRLPLLSLWGRNPLVFYILHYFLLAFLVLPGVPWWYAQATPWLTAIQAVGLVALLSAAGKLMDSKGWVLSL